FAFAVVLPSIGGCPWLAVVCQTAPSPCGSRRCEEGQWTVRTGDLPASSHTLTDKPDQPPQTFRQRGVDRVFCSRSLLTLPFRLLFRWCATSKVQAESFEELLSVWQGQGALTTDESKQLG